MQNDGTAYLGHNPTAQPCRDNLQCWYRVHTPKRRCGQIKFEPISVSKAQNSGNAYLTHAHAVQPLATPLKHPHRVHRPSHQCGWIKFASRNVSWAQEVETAHLWCRHATHPHRSPQKPSYRVIGPKHQCGWLIIVPASISWKQKERNTHLGRVCVTQPCWNAPRHPYEAVGPKRRCGRIKLEPRNVRWTEMDGNAHQGPTSPYTPYHLIWVIPRNPHPSDIFHTAFRTWRVTWKRLVVKTASQSHPIRTWVQMDATTRSSRSCDLPNLVMTLQSLQTFATKSLGHLSNGLHIHLESLSTHSFDI